MAEQTDVMLSDEEVGWLKECKAKGFDSVLEIQELRSRVMVAEAEAAAVRDRYTELLAGWVPPAHWPQEAWDVLLNRHFDERVEIGEQWVLFRRPGA